MAASSVQADYADKCALRRARRAGLVGSDGIAYAQTVGQTRTALLPWGFGFIEVSFRGDPELDHICTPPIFNCNLYGDPKRELRWAEHLSERQFTREQWRRLGEMLDQQLFEDRETVRYMGTKR